MKLRSSHTSILLAVFALTIASPRAEEPATVSPSFSKTECVRQLLLKLSTGLSPENLAKKFVIEPWKNYKKELAEEGPQRLLFYRQEAKSAGDVGRILINNPTGLGPMALNLAMARFVKRNLTILPQIVIAGVWAAYISHKETEKTAKAEATIPGTDYLESFQSYGILDTRETLSQMFKHDENLEKWKQAEDLKTGALPRALEWQRLDLIDDKDLDSLDRLARQAWHAAFISKDPAAFTERLTKEWSHALESDPKLSKKDPALLSMLTTYFMPVVKIGKKTDVELTAILLGLKKEPSFDVSGLQTALSSGEKDLPGLEITLSRSLDPKKQREFQDQWRSAFGSQIPAPKRAAFADFDGQISFGKTDLKSESDYFNLIARDARFSSIKTALLKGQTTDVDASAFARKVVIAFKQVEAASEARSTPKTLCPLLKENLLFASLKKYMTHWQDEEHPTKRQAQVCRYRAAAVYFDLLLHETPTQNNEDEESRRITHALETCAESATSSSPSCPE